MCDMDVWKAAAKKLFGDLTFLEAYQRTGRVLNISMTRADRLVREGIAASGRGRGRECTLKSRQEEELEREGSAALYTGASARWLFSLVFRLALSETRLRSSSSSCMHLLEG